DFTRADAGGAHAEPLPGTVHQRPHRLQVDVPAALCQVMGMADPVAELGPAPAYFTYFRHKTELSSASNSRLYQGRRAAATLERFLHKECLRERCKDATQNGRKRSWWWTMRTPSGR